MENVGVTKFTVEALVDIEIALRKLLAVKGTGLSFAIVKNLDRLKSKQKTYYRNYQKIQEHFTEKDEKGKPVQYAVEKVEGHLTFVVDSEGKPVIGKGPDGSQTRINSDDPEYIDAVAQLNAEEHEVIFHCIAEEKIEELASACILDGVDYSTLLNVVIKPQSAIK
jgi:hypothetical protein